MRRAWWAAGPSLLISVVLVAACVASVPSPVPGTAPAGPTAAPRDGDVVIVATTQARIDGVAVGAGNIWEGAYPLPDGSERTGASAGLWIGGNPAIRVGAGSVVQIGPARWEVIAVERAGNGQVRLRRLAS